MKKLLYIIRHNLLPIVFLSCILFLMLVLFLGLPALSTDNEESLIPAGSQVEINEGQYTEVLHQQEQRAKQPTTPLLNPFSPSS